MKAGTAAAIAAVLLVVCLFGAPALAQEDYYIRADARINLRASYSLEAEKVTTVAAGTTLHVIGRFNRWLKIDLNGETVWMADWVNYTRVDGAGDGGGQQTSSQEETQADEPFDLDSYQIVNNCCQVDRQCNSEHEWTAGYMAFQHGHCKLPQVESSVGGIHIVGTQAFVIQVEKALNLLRNRSAHWYTYVTNGLDRINEGTDMFSGYVDLQTRTFSFSQGGAFVGGAGESALAWLIGVFAHEACHVYRFEVGLVAGGLEGERNCLAIQIEALEAADPHDYHQGYLRNLLANIDNVEYQWWWR